MIIATAGHVDHGKTALIRQLTGVETDRLEEEQRRGLSINLGYAYLSRPGHTALGFIDVPGHQRFINNMISGISGIDTGLLVIAADDGPMPQTYEHLDILQLLGIENLVVVISKIDRVTNERVDEIQKQVQEILSNRPWKNTAFFAVSNTTGDGIEILKTDLLSRAETVKARTSAGYFRLSIDRAFTAKGAGLVVTGTVSAGSVSVGDSLTLLPQGLDLRIRALRVHDQDAETALAGQRCALNITGKVDAAAIERGDWLVEEGAAPVANRIDVDFSLLASAPFSLKYLSPIKMHIGAKRVPGRIALLKTERCGNRLHPGDNCLAQLVLEHDVACFRGERFLLRDHAENITLGGGIILDPSGPRTRRSHPERIAFLNAMKADSPAEALTELITQQQLVNLDSFRQTWNLRVNESEGLSLPDTRGFNAQGCNWIVGLARWQAVDAALLAYLDQWHLQEPEQPGIKATALKQSLEKSCEPPLLMAVLTSRLQSSELVLSEGRLRRAGFQPAVNTELTQHWLQLQTFLQDRGNNIPLLSEVATHTRFSPKALEKIIKAQEKNGQLHRLTAQRYALPAQLYRLSSELLSLADTGEPVTVVGAKSRFAIGRNLTVEILEYFDRIHFTQRTGNARIVLDSELPARVFNR